MTKLLYIVWDFDPTMFTIGSLDIRYYGAMWALVLLLGSMIFSRFCKIEGRPQELSDSAFLYIALGTIIGARLGHCLFYEPMDYLPAPWKIITGIRDGGLASHGASIGILVSIWLCARKNKISPLWLTDRLVIIAAIGGAFIRLGNLFNSEIIGRTTTLPWGFKFVRLFREGTPIDMIPAQHPTQIYEALCYVVTFCVLIAMYRYTKAARREGLLFGVGLIGIFLTRFFIEFVKVEQEQFEQGMILNMGQLLSVPFIVCGVWMIVRAMRRPLAEQRPAHEPQKR